MKTHLNVLIIASVLFLSTSAHAYHLNFVSGSAVTESTGYARLWDQTSSSRFSSFIIEGDVGDKETVNMHLDFYLDAYAFAEGYMPYTTITAHMLFMDDTYATLVSFRPSVTNKELDMDLTRYGYSRSTIFTNLSDELSLTVGNLYQFVIPELTIFADYDEHGFTETRYSGFFDLSYGEPVATPEPSSILLLFIGFAGLTGFGWKRKK